MGDDKVGQERVVLYGGSPSVRLAGGDELLDPHESVAGGPPLRGAEVDWALVTAAPDRGEARRCRSRRRCRGEAGAA